MGKDEFGGKTDMERVGLFNEMGYISIGDKYVPAGKMAFNISAGKGKQLLPGGHKVKAATQAGYFADKYGRIMENEAYSDPIKMRRQYRLKELKKNITQKPFVPSDGYKHGSGLGSHYGTIGGKHEYFAAISRPFKKESESAKNFYTSPAKRGTGYGYLSVTLSQYPRYQSEPYGRDRDLEKQSTKDSKRKQKGPPFRLNMHPTEYFTHNPFAGESFALSRKISSPAHKGPIFRPSHPGKRLGGNKAGTFDPYPKHSEDPYLTRKKYGPSDGKMIGKTTFYPSMGPKSKPQRSVVNQNVLRRMNVQNYRSAAPVGVSLMT